MTTGGAKRFAEYVHHPDKNIDAGHFQLATASFQRHLQRLLNADEPPPGEARVVRYMGFYGFRRVRDETVNSEDDYPGQDLFYHSRIGGAYTLRTLRRSPIRKISEALGAWATYIQRLLLGRRSITR